MMKCFCGYFYIGKTKRQFFKRIRDHALIDQKQLMETSVSVGLYHNFDLHMIKFVVLEHVPTHVRGGSIDQKLLQLEARWIRTLTATIYPGLN